MKDYSKKDIEEFQLALRMTGVDIHIAICETMLLVNEGYKKKGDKFSLMDACTIMAKMKSKYPNGQFYQSIKIGQNFEL